MAQSPYEVPRNPSPTAIPAVPMMMTVIPRSRKRNPQSPRLLRPRLRVAATMISKV